MGTLRKLFGPSRKEIWRQLSAAIDARYVEGGFWKGDKVQATHGEWTITLDTFAVEGVDDLSFIVVGVIKDVERLKRLYELFAETLEQLCRIGSAYQKSPNVTM